jgi:glutathione S-transferase
MSNPTEQSKYHVLNFFFQFISIVTNITQCFIGPITVGYWSIRGLGAPLRAMVMYSGVPLNCVMYNTILKEDGSFCREEWTCTKPALKEQNPLMNLPYIIDGDKVIAQTNACFAYLGRRLGMWGSTEDEHIECEQLLCEIMDLRNYMIRFAYGADFSEAQGAALLNNVRCPAGIFPKLELWLEREVTKRGHSGTFLVGDSATAPDFHLHEMLIQYDRVAMYTPEAGDLLADFPRLQHFKSTFEQLPAYQRYLSSRIGCIAPFSLPFNAKMAGFGGDCSNSPQRWSSSCCTEFHSYSGIY